MRTGRSRGSVRLLRTDAGSGSSTTTTRRGARSAPSSRRSPSRTSDGTRVAPGRARASTAMSSLPAGRSGRMAAASATPGTWGRRPRPRSGRWCAHPSSPRPSAGGRSSTTPGRRARRGRPCASSRPGTAGRRRLRRSRPVARTPRQAASRGRTSWRRVPATPQSIRCPPAFDIPQQPFARAPRLTTAGETLSSPCARDLHRC